MGRWRGGPLAAEGDDTSLLMAGSRNAMVLPVPVLAWARTSLPARVEGRVSACTAVMVVRRRSLWMVSRRTGLTSNAARLAKDCAPVAVVALGCCCACAMGCASATATPDAGDEEKEEVVKGAEAEAEGWAVGGPRRFLFWFCPRGKGYLRFLEEPSPLDEDPVAVESWLGGAMVKMVE